MTPIAQAERSTVCSRQPGSRAEAAWREQKRKSKPPEPINTGSMQSIKIKMLERKAAILAGTVPALCAALAILIESKLRPSREAAFPSDQGNVAQRARRAAVR